MTFVSFLFWLFLAIIIGGVGGGFAIGYYCGREDTADPRTWEKHPDSDPYRDGLDDTWARLLAAWGDDPALEQAEPGNAIPAGRPTALLRPSGRLASTGELRALAYAGDTDALNASNDAFMADLNDKDDTK